MARKPRLPELPVDPTLAAAWHRVLDIAAGVRDLAPWEHIAPAAVLGVEDPVSGETDWCAAMGHNGEVLGIAMYPGDAGYAALRRLERREVDELDLQIAQRAVTLIFESAATLMPPTKKLFKAIDRKFRGATAWPEVLVHEPGFVPAAPRSTAELERVANALAGVASLVPWAGDDPDGGVCRVAGKTWATRPPFAPHDRRLVPLPNPVDPPPPPPPPFDQLAAARLQSSDTPRKGQWYLDWFCGMGIIDGPEAEGRPYFVTHVIAIDLGSGMLLGVEVGHLAEAAADVQKLVLRTATQQGLPETLLVRRAELRTALQPLAASLGVALSHDVELASVSRHLREQMATFMGH